MAWDDAKRSKAIKMYTEAEPTPDTSIEIIKDIAEKLEETPNGVRMILTKAEVYIKKETSTSGAKSTEKTTRVSKADSIAELKNAIEAGGLQADVELLDKLTGKQAVYLATIIKTLLK
jgi:hypothetical protein